MNPPIIVIGTGPVGIRSVQEISAKIPDAAISLYGDEPVKPYNRVQLTHYLAGKENIDDIRNDPAIHANTRLSARYGCRILRIDPEKKSVHTEKGGIERYSKLVIATGSTAHTPSLPNLGIDGVFTLRTLADADRIKSWKGRAVVVLGGGLLGLETARALVGAHTRVTVVDHSLHLMSRQLDRRAGDMLKEEVEAIGIAVALADPAIAVNGDSKIESVTLRSGKTLACDSLILAVGIRPNIELAKSAGLRTRRGIVVNEFMQTSEPDIYAVGECAEFANMLYGIVAPGFEQAGVMAAHLCGGYLRYQGTTLSTRLKVLDFPVFSMGEVGEHEAGTPRKTLIYEDKANKRYRRLIFDRECLIGGIAMGEWSELSLLRTAIEQKKRIWPWQQFRFWRTGLVWADPGAESVAYWPESAIVCNCNQISQGRLTLAIKQGCSNVAALSCATKAATVCGSCRPLLAELLGTRIEPAKLFKTLGALSLVALLASLATLLLPALPYRQIGTAAWHYDAFWRDHFIKQATGFSLLGGTVLVLLMSLRKRIHRFRWGDFAYWRLLHIAPGILIVSLLAAHTGFRFGAHGNFYLMIFFTGLLAIGSSAGLVIAGEHALHPGLARKLRSGAVLLHILLFWPIPALLGLHILKSYYF